MLLKPSVVWMGKHCGLGRDVSFVEVGEQSQSCLYEKAVTLWLANNVTVISALLMERRTLPGLHGAGVIIRTACEPIAICKHP